MATEQKLSIDETREVGGAGDFFVTVKRKKRSVFVVRENKLKQEGQIAYSITNGWHSEHATEAVAMEWARWRVRFLTDREAQGFPKMSGAMPMVELEAMLDKRAEWAEQWKAENPAPVESIE